MELKNESKVYKSFKIDQDTESDLENKMEEQIK